MKPRFLAVWLFLAWVWAIPGVASDTAAASGPASRWWKMAAQEQMTLEQRGVILSDASLTRYLQGVAERLWQEVPTDLSTPTVKIIMDSRVEAYAYPNGQCFLTTGMLDIIENESQLAMILAHEIVHYASQHTAALYHHFQSDVPQGGLTDADQRNHAGKPTMPAAIDAAEHQADHEGLTILIAAGYCETEVLPLMSNLRKGMPGQSDPETESSLKTRAAFFRKRINDLQQRPSCSASTDTTPDDYLDRIAPALMANAQVALRCGEWAQAERSISKFMVSEPDNARAYYLKGELLRRKNRGEQALACIGSYEKALKIDPTFPSAHRALGELYYKAGRYQKAKPYFEAFLSLVPQDLTREYIKGYLRQCQH